jgi:hypothetical protein
MLQERKEEWYSEHHRLQGEQDRLLDEQNKHRFSRISLG